jgi:general secretion pathway protein F
MPAFRYLAIAPSGELTRGAMEGASEADVVARLQRQGAIPMRVEPDTGGGFLADLLRAPLDRGRALSRQEIAEITRELATMLGAGQDLDRALRFVAETAPRRRVRGIVGEVREVVRDGSALAAALAKHPRSFAPLYVGLVRAGEAGGTLAATLQHLASLLERERSLAASIAASMAYPIVLLVAAIGVIMLLLIEVLPQFVPLFEQAGAALPRATRILIAAGDLISANGVYGLLGLAVLFVTTRQLLHRPGPRLAADRLLLRLPVAGALTREVMAARFSRTLGTLLLNGVPLIAALGIVKDAIGNLAGAAAVETASIQAKGGGGLADALAASGIFPLRTVHLVRLGEETAQLGVMALRAAEIHEEKVRLGLQRLVALLVPAVTIAMGAAVAGIVASLLLAMLSLNDLAQ